MAKPTTSSHRVCGPRSLTISLNVCRSRVACHARNFNTVAPSAVPATTVHILAFNGFDPACYRGLRCALCIFLVVHVRCRASLGFPRSVHVAPTQAPEAFPWIKRKEKRGSVRGPCKDTDYASCCSAGMGRRGSLGGSAHDSGWCHFQS